MRAMHELTAPAKLRAPFAAVHALYTDAIYAATAATQLQIGRHAERVAERWDTMSPWVRAAHEVGTLSLGLTVGTIAARLSGDAAHAFGVDHVLATLPQTSGAPAASAAPEHFVLAAAVEHTTAHSIHDHGITLPADISRAPSTVNLGPYNNKNGNGTLWNWGAYYADELGYGNLTSDQQHAMTVTMLDANDKTWEQARDLQPDYNAHFPTQDKAIHALQEAGATKTQHADRPDPIPVNLPPASGGTNTPNMPPTEQLPGQTTPAIADCIPPNAPWWYPLQYKGSYPFRSFWDCAWTGADAGNVAIIGAAIASGFVAQRILATDKTRTVGTQPLYSQRISTGAPTSKATAEPPVVTRGIINPSRSEHHTRNAILTMEVIAASRALLDRTLNKTTRRKKKATAKK
ncbi:MAG TPA: hypothetical protein VLE73_06125 [Candidatus Saccharimonadales bacterium]|nr:hypothetical protein [Candidatus Saccharimonadales bacterium]